MRYRKEVGALLGLAVWLFSLSDPASGEITTVWFETTEMSAEEAGRLRFRLVRDRPDGDLLVRIAVAGTARHGVDYVLVGGEIVDGRGLSLSFPSGESTIDAEIDILDDTAAEPEETLVLKLGSVGEYVVDPARAEMVITIALDDVLVVNTNDSGEGSLRQALLNALAMEGPDTITFDPEVFSEPKTISLASELPELTGQIVIDGYIEDRLWRASGVTLSGGGRHRIFRVGTGAAVTVRHITLSNGFALDGGGITNQGNLVVHGVTFLENIAERDGGAVVNVGGTMFLVNSTFALNTAEGCGGGLAAIGGISNGDQLHIF